MNCTLNFCSDQPGMNQMYQSLRVAKILLSLYISCAGECVTISGHHIKCWPLTHQDKLKVSTVTMCNRMAKLSNNPYHNTLSTKLNKAMLGMHRLCFLQNNCLEICNVTQQPCFTIHFTNHVLNKNIKTFMFFPVCPKVYNNHSIFLVVI